MNPALAMLIVVAAFVALMLGVRAACRGGWLGAEGARKAVHIGMGAGTLSFPWLFTETWAVLALTGAFVALLLALRFVPVLCASFGEVLCGVGRSSWGDLYFPIAVGGLFWLTRGEPLNFVIPMLVLTFADAAAALAGVRFGRLRFITSDGGKSWEGSLAFFVTAFGCVFVPLVVAGQPPTHSALTALCIAAVTMLAEATAWRGLDNLFVPFATLAMLRIYREQTDAALWGRVGVLVLLGALHFGWRKRAQLREGALLGALVLIFVLWNIGSPAWAVAPLTLLVLHPLPRWWRAGVAPEPQSHPAILSLGLPALAWLFAWRFFGVNGFVPGVVTFAAQLAMTGVSVWRADARRAALLPLAAAFGWLCIIGPHWWMGEIGGSTAWLSGAAVGAAAVVLHFVARPLFGRPREYWTVRAILAVLASFAAFSS